MTMAEKPTTLATVTPIQQPVAIAPDRPSIIAPRTFDEALRFAKALAGSDLAPKDFRDKPDNVMIALQMGYEVGLSPMAAIQNIAVINGRPSIWGDAALAIVMAHRDYEFHKETFEGPSEARIAICEIKRRGHDLHTVRFSVADAKTGGLWKKDGPWTKYPDRMLQMRARSWAIRDKFADALRGLNIGEEVQDYQVIESTALPPNDTRKNAIKDEIDALLTSVGMNAANRMALIGTNEADLPLCLESLKTIKFVLTAQSIPVQQWPALLQKFSRNLASYASELKGKHEQKNGAAQEEPPQEQKESAAPQQGQQPADAARTGATTSSGDARPSAEPQDSLFITKEDTKPSRQPVAAGATKRFTY